MNLHRQFIVVKPARKIHLSKIDTSFTAGLAGKEQAQPMLQKHLQRISDFQYRLYAQSRRGLLIVLQAIDTGGKDGLIRHVMTAFNPQSCRVKAFKAPTVEELAHDFLWRVHSQTPRLGEVMVFNRSHYEDIVAVRVRKLARRDVWQARYEAINDFESLLTEAGVKVVKFLLHISRSEQRRRLQARQADPSKQWKLDPQDMIDQKLYAQYMRAYEDVLERCSPAHAPWHVIPADHKWFRDVAVAQILARTLEEMESVGL
jgi:PPK2 family polyphosphate:nucleotide phosphotransferase